mmetsp:Transcript_32956/g.95417  ORF Transcript_32956/g.95417 Transcript_32956/m.95417 type:complete len:262 (-) Transcript_32956:491-1276(-)
METAVRSSPGARRPGRGSSTEMDDLREERSAETRRRCSSCDSTTEDGWPPSPAEDTVDRREDSWVSCGLATCRCRASISWPIRRISVSCVRFSDRTSSSCSNRSRRSMAASRASASTAACPSFRSYASRSWNEWVAISLRSSSSLCLPLSLSLTSSCWCRSFSTSVRLLNSWRASSWTLRSRFASRSRDSDAACLRENLPATASAALSSAALAFSLQMLITRWLSSAASAISLRILASSSLAAAALSSAAATAFSDTFCRH